MMSVMVRLEFITSRSAQQLTRKELVNKMWKQYKDTNYSISTNGEVKNNLTGKILSQSIQQGYKHVTLLINNKQKRCRVHRLVAETFVNNPENKPYVNHIDGDRANNNVENLEWVTPSENTIHAVKLGIFKSGVKRAVNQYDLDGNFMMQYESIVEAAKQSGASETKITACCKKERKTSGDFQWRYADEEQDVGKVSRSYNVGRKVAQCDENGNIIAVFPSFREAAAAVDGTSSAISRVCSGLNVRHKGYKWKLVDDIVQDD